ncbi:MAG: radical SAM family heme chaperone HemW [Pseudomonadota bacterium]
MTADPGFGLYLHWPYCAQKCPYCDFNSFARTPEDATVWADAYVQEIERHAALVGPQTLRSIYFGGGTPSLMEAETVQAVIDAAQKVWRFANDIEITLEANPSSVEQGRFWDFKAAGVNRLSLGVQALKEDDLRRLGRLHSIDDALQALDVSRSTFDRVSFDLIYARQNQTIEDWSAELTQALSFDPGHLSLYQLTIEPGTAFHDRFHRGNLKGLPDEDVSADMFELTQDMTAAAGLPAYEISNHARPGLQSRHNLIYWSGGSWAGIGPGAHGRLWVDGQRVGTESFLDPAHWLKQVAASGGTRVSETLSQEDIANEYIMMGLRQVDGISQQRLHTILGSELCIDPDLVDMGFLDVSNDHIRTTAKGRPLLNQIIEKLLV